MLFLHLFVRCFPEMRRRNPKVERAIGVSRVAGALSNSWMRRERLVGLKSSSSFHSEKKNNHRNANKMGTRHRMIEQFIEEEKAIHRILGEDKNCRHLLPTSQDVGMLQLVSKVLDPLLRVHRCSLR